MRSKFGNSKVRQRDKSYRAELFDRHTHQTLKSRDIECPRGLRAFQFHPELHANRFLVNVIGSRIDYLDLDRPDSKFESLTFATQSGGGSHLINTPYDQMQLLIETVPEAGIGSPPTHVDLFQFLANGQLEHVRAWQTERSDMTAVWRELLVTIPLGTQQAEVRSLRTDELSERRDCPPNFDPKPRAVILHGRRMGPCCGTTPSLAPCNGTHCAAAHGQPIPPPN